MAKVTKSGSGYIGYDYKEVTVPAALGSRFLDGYENFGWICEASVEHVTQKEKVTLKFKRDRRIVNKMELTRLQQHFDACMEEIGELEKTKKSRACAYAVSIGVLGTVFMACATFAATHEPPLVWPCILSAVPGFAGWTAPYFVYRYIFGKRSLEIAPLLEHKYDELYEICKKGSQLLS